MWLVNASKDHTFFSDLYHMNYGRFSWKRHLGRHYSHASVMLQNDCKSESQVANIYSLKSNRLSYSKFIESRRKINWGALRLDDFLILKKRSECFNIKSLASYNPSIFQQKFSCKFLFFFHLMSFVMIYTVLYTDYSFPICWLIFGSLWWYLFHQPVPDLTLKVTTFGLESWNNLK